MAVDSKELTRKWISYLKNNRIVAQNSDPATGLLKYNRPTTSEDMRRFLELYTDFSADMVDDAIRVIRAAKFRKQPKTSDNAPSQGTPNNLVPPERRVGSAASAGKISHDPNSISDVDYREINDKDADSALRKKTALDRNIFPRLPGKRGGKSSMKEAIRDETGFEIDEQDVEELFRELAIASAEAKKSSSNNKKSPEEIRAQQEEDIRKIKQMIRNTLNDEQRLALWRIITDNSSTLNEAELSNADIAAVFQNAVNISRPSIMGRMNPFGRKQVSLDSMVQAWKKAGRPDDSADIKYILQDLGLKDPEIEKAFRNVFSSQGQKSQEYDIPPAMAKIKKLGNYIKEKGLADEIIEFMKREYKLKESFDGQKFVSEDIMKIFTFISEQKSVENLGRKKKSHIISNESLVSLGDILSLNQYYKIMSVLKPAVGPEDIKFTKIKNQIITDWNKGIKSKKHISDLLSQIDINLNSILD